MRRTIREKPVHNQANNREEEDADTPKELVQRGTVGLQDLNPDYDIENKNDEPDDTASTAVFPGVVVSSNGRLLCHGEGEEEELEEQAADCVGQHGCMFCV